MKINSENRDLQRRLEAVIPGGAHTYSKGKDQYPSNAPSVLAKGKGSRVWDSNGAEYLDYGMGLKSVLLGYGIPEIVDAAHAEMLKGNNLSRPSFIELEAAELLVDLIESAEMVKFAKNGSNVTTAAIKMSRAFTGKKYVCVPEEQPFFSFDDWFIGSTAISKGVPEEHHSLTLKFNYGDIASLERLFSLHAGEIAAVILEPATDLLPCSTSCEFDVVPNCKTCPFSGQNFLKQVEELCKKNSSIFILDEMRTGFRWDIGGAQRLFNVTPDLSTFGKGIANGFSLAALTGKREIMELAGIQHEGQERTFLLSSTHGAEMSSLGAFVATAKFCQEKEVSKYLWLFGNKLLKKIDSIICELEISASVQVKGPAVAFEIYFIGNENVSKEELKTLFLQEMLASGVMLTFWAPSFSHNESDLELTEYALRNALVKVRKALENGASDLLAGPVVKPVFRKFN